MIIESKKNYDLLRTSIIEVETLLDVDRALEIEADDRLDRSRIIKVLADSLVQNTSNGTRATGRVVGLTGPWGSGKSTILNFLEARLSEEPDTFVVRFNPWIVTGSENLIDVYFKEITHQLGRSGKEKARDLAMRLEDYREGLAGVADLVLPGSGIFNKVIPKIKEPSIQEKRSELEGKLSKFEGAVVVIIDELDRVDDRDVRELARFTKAVGDLPGISYVIGYDHVRVQRALSRGAALSEGEEYLKKIVQVNIPIRPMMDFEAQNIITDGLDKEFTKTLDEMGDEFQDAIYEVCHVINTPRDAKRFCATANAYWYGAGQEINACDILLFSAIAAASSDLRSFLIDRIQEIVDDPTDRKVVMREAFRRDIQGNRLEDIGFEKDRFSKFSDILKMLFPRLGSREFRSDFGRISQINNFIKLVYFGDPPFIMSRGELLKLWEKPVQDNLEEVLNSNKIDQLPDRIERLFQTLNPEGDEPFFRGLSTYILSKGLEERVSFRELLDQIRWMCIRIAKQNAVNISRVERLIYALAHANDTVFLPSLIRHHMFAFGMAEGFDKRDNFSVIPEEFFREIHLRAITHYVEILTAGEWHKWFCTADPFFAVEQSGHYFDDVRASVSLRVETPDLALSFCLLVAPPGVSIERESLQRLVDLECLRRGLDKLTGQSRTSEIALTTVRSALGS